MVHRVVDTEAIRRANRARVLDVVRREGTVSRSRIATLTGLSNASLTAIGADLMAQGILREVVGEPQAEKARGRPAVGLAHNRSAAYVILIELEVSRCRLSLLDYAGVLIDRLESGPPAEAFKALLPEQFLHDRVQTLVARNVEAMDSLAGIAISAQGILSPARHGLRWSPIQGLAGADFVSPLSRSFGVPVDLYKRGRLMADGTAWLHPELARASCATIYIGATIGMGLSLPTGERPPTDSGTDFGHMNHLPDGALCRCGARGCIEAYAADYGVLRTAFGVPEHTQPAQSVPAPDYQGIIGKARRGDRNAQHAFNGAGRALGFGISRLLSIIEISHLVLLGPGTAAFDLMAPAFESAIRAGLPGRMNGLPDILLTPDAGEPIFRGLMMNALTTLDHDHFAPMSGQLTRKVAQ